MDMRRLVTLTISFSALVISAILASGDQLAANPDENPCEEKKCSPDGPAVRFPFILQGKQPEICGNGQGYNLTCDELNHTILELPSLSIKFSVVKIDYISNTIQVRSPEGCLAKHLRDLDMSTFPFQTVFPSLHQYSLFNCSTSNYYLVNIRCLDNHGYKVYAALADARILYHPPQFCTKMYDTKLIAEALFQENSIMNLFWPLPRCETGGICLRQDGTQQIVRFGGSGVLSIPSTGVIIWIIVPMLPATVFCLAYSIKKRVKANQTRIRKFLQDYAAMKPTRYSYADIKRMTNNFKDKVGKGGYGNVFKGKVANEILVAVKLLHNSTRNGDEFINEVGTMGRIHHVNVVRLLGFCAEGSKRALVYEFLPNGSLDKFIFPEGKEHHTLGIEMLQDIAIGIARGVEYLHQGCEHSILHFDIKPHNILLDENYIPKVSDFGLAKLCKKGKSAVSMTAARGTMGYIAPEVFSRHFGNVSYKSDIYSFGMLLLEMVGRRKNIDANVETISQVYFPEWVYGRLVKGEELRIQVEGDDVEDKIGKKLAIVGLWCIQWNPADRPSITSVLQMLEGSGENLSLPPDPFNSSSATNPPNPTEYRRQLGSPLAVISESESE